MARAVSGPGGPAVRVQGASVVRGGRPLLDALDFEVGDGEVVALVGASGAGKSTALRLVNGLVSPDAGRVTTLGEDASRGGPALRRRIGYVAQGGGLFPHRTVGQNVAAVPELLGWPAGDIAASVDEALASAGLDPARFRERRPRQLSGGEAQRAAFARAIAARPRLLLLDEPFGALDAITRRRLQHELARLLRDGRSAVLVTHDIDEAFALADRVAVLEGGRVAQSGTREALTRAPATPLVAELVRAAVRP